MTDEPVRLCQLCGQVCVRRKTEMRDTFSMRRYCSKKCNIASHRPQAAAARRAEVQAAQTVKA